jgi:hypothetical protein
MYSTMLTCETQRPASVKSVETNMLKCRATLHV